MASARNGAGLPSFIIIGAMKSGTSSLHHYLRRHPGICMSSAKETNFFIEAGNFGKGLDWYRSMFADHTKICGEVSPSYSKRHRHQSVPERLHRLVPHVKLIYLLRDPIDRIVSHYLHNRIAGRETRPLAAAATAKSYQNNYVQTSMYRFQLMAFLSYFRLEKILIATSEDLKDQRAETLRSIFRFIGVDPDFEGKEFHRLFNQTPAAGQASGRAAMGGDRGASGVLPSWQGSDAMAALDPEERDRLTEHLAPDLAGLRALTGLRFERWSL